MVYGYVYFCESSGTYKIIIHSYNMTKILKRKREKTPETAGEVKSFMILVNK